MRDPGQSAFAADGNPAPLPVSGARDVASRLQSALAHTTARRHAEAERDCREVLAASPHHPRATILLCRVVAEQGRVAEARQILERSDLPDAARQTAAEAVDGAAFRQFLVGLRQAVFRRELDRARDMLHGADPAWLQRAQLRLLAARLSLEEGRPAEAEGICREVMLTSDETATAADLLCRALAMQRRVDEARDIFAKVLWPMKGMPEGLAKSLKLLCETGSADEVQAFLSRLESIRPPSAEEQQRLARAEARIGRASAAAARLAAAERLGPLDTEQAGQLAILLAQSGQLEEALQRIAAVHAQDPDNPVWLQRMVQIHVAAGNADTAADLVEQGLDRWADDPNLLFSLSAAKVTPERFDRIFAGIREARAEGRLSRMALFRFSTLALLAGDIAAAVAALEEMRPPRESVPAGMLAFLHHMSATGAPPERLRDDMTQDFQIVRATGAVATLVVFPTVLNLFGSLPLSQADRALAGHPVNVIYLRDLRRRAFLQPRPELGGSAEGLADKVRDLRAQLDALPLVTLGLSGGGFSAMRYAPLLRAGAAIALSGQTRLYAAEERPSFVAQNRGLSFLSTVPPEDRDVLPGLAAAPDLKVWHVAAEDNLSDRHQQDRIRHLPNVTCLTVPGSHDHDTFFPALAGGHLDRILREAFQAVRNHAR